MFGRKRRLYKYLYNSDMAMRSYGERQAMNSRVQGSAADLIKAATVKVAPVARELGCTLIGTIHDENLFYVPENITDDQVMTIKSTMENAVDIGVPITCDGELYDRWGHRIKKY
jgi:DNA polymerase-1